MDKLKTLQTELETARNALTALQDELPQFHSLLTDNEQNAQRLKSERASLDAQAQARGRVQVAREMLEQHQSDIRTAQAEVERLETLSERERVITELTRHAQASLSAKGALERALEKANTTLEKGVESVLAQHTELLEATRAFAAVGADKALTAELAARGVAVAQPNMPGNLPHPHGLYIWNIVLTQMQQRAQAALMAESARRRALQKQAGPVEPSKLKLLFSQTDVYAAAKRLGDLVLQEVSYSNSFLGKPDQFGLIIWEGDLQDARERLQGAGAFEVAPYA